MNAAKIFKGILILGIAFSVLKFSTVDNTGRYEKTVRRIAKIPQDAKVVSVKRTNGGMEPAYLFVLTSDSSAQLIFWAEQIGLSFVSDPQTAREIYEAFKIGFKIDGSAEEYISYKGVIRGTSFFSHVLVINNKAYVDVSKF